MDSLKEFHEKGELRHLINKELFNMLMEDELTAQNLTTIYNCIDTIKENDKNFAVHIEKVFRERQEELLKKAGYNNRETKYK